MERLHQRFMTIALIGVLLLAPVLISGGGHALDAAALSAGVKMPEVSTIGPEMQPYQMTPGEIDKLKLHATTDAAPTDVRRPGVSPSPRALDGAYTGMTPAEIDKLARWREARAGTDMPMREGPSVAPAKFESLPRAPGIEGLTPAERAKLETYLKSRR